MTNARTSTTPMTNAFIVMSLPLLVLRPPLDEGQLLRLGNVGGRHFLGNNVAVFCGVLVALACREVIPFVRLYVVLRHPPALVVHEAEVVLDPRVATDLINLAQLLQATNRLAEAEPLMRRALRIDGASFDEDHPHWLIGTLANRLGRYNHLFDRGDFGRFTIARGFLR